MDEMRVYKYTVQICSYLQHLKLKSLLNKKIADSFIVKFENEYNIFCIGCHGIY